MTALKTELRRAQQAEPTAERWHYGQAVGRTCDPIPWLVLKGPKSEELFVVVPGKSLHDMNFNLSDYKWFGPVPDCKEGERVSDHRADCQLLTVPTFGLCTCDFDQRKEASLERQTVYANQYRFTPEGSLPSPWIELCCAHDKLHEAITCREVTLALHRGESVSTEFIPADVQVWLKEAHKDFGGKMTIEARILKRIITEEVIDA